MDRTRTTGPLRAGVVSGLVPLLLAGCVMGEESVQSPGTTFPVAHIDVTFELEQRPFAGAVVYLLAGPTPGSQDVYRMDGDTGPVDRLTQNPFNFGVSWMSASRDAVVLADAESGRDRLVVLTDAGKAPLPGEPPGVRGFSPTLSPDGRLIYSRFPRSDPTPGQRAGRELVVRESLDGPSTVVFSNPSTVTGIWGPDGLVVLLAHPGVDEPDRPIEVYLLDPAGGEPEQLHPELDRPAVLAGHPDADWVAVSDPKTQTAGLLDPRTGAWVDLPEGWIALCFAPSGDQLLVGRAEELALVPVDNPTELEPIGVTHDGTVIRCSWLAK